MPSDNFEQSLRERLQGVEFPPQPEVWDGIKTRLQAPKWYQKKGWIGGMAAALGFLLILAGYFWLSPSPTGTEKLAKNGASQDSSAQESMPVLPDSMDGPSATSDQSSGFNEDPASTEKENLPKPPLQSSPADINSNTVSPASSKNFALIPSPESQSGWVNGKSPDSSSVPGTLEGKGMNEMAHSAPSAPSSQFLLKTIDLPEFQGGFLSELGPVTAEQVTMERLSGAALPAPSKFSITFFARPEMIWYTSASISVEQEPVRDFEVDDPLLEFPAATQNAPSIVFYEVTYARTGISTGITAGYYLNPKLSLHTGMSLFVSGKHKLSPLYPLLGSDSSRVNSSLPEYTMQNVQLEIPLTAQYIFASDRSSWVFTGGVSFNKSINDLDFGPSSTDLEVRSPTAFTPFNQPLLVQKSSHIHASLGFLYRFHVNSDLNLYVGPTHNYSLSPVFTTSQGKSIFLNRLALQVGVEFR